MAIAKVTFIQYYTYEVDIDEKDYEDDPWEAEESAIEKAYASFYTDMCQPIARTVYDNVEIEVEVN